MKFKVKDNFGKIHTSKEYEWNKDAGIPEEETILEEMESDCTNNCQTESQMHCDCSPEFDEGEVIGVIK